MSVATPGRRRLAGGARRRSRRAAAGLRVPILAAFLAGSLAAAPASAGELLLNPALGLRFSAGADRFVEPFPGDRLALVARVLDALGAAAGGGGAVFLARGSSIEERRLAQRRWQATGNALADRLRLGVVEAYWATEKTAPAAAALDMDELRLALSTASEPSEGCPWLVWIEDPALYAEPEATALLSEGAALLVSETGALWAEPLDGLVGLAAAPVSPTSLRFITADEAFETVTGPVHLIAANRSLQPLLGVTMESVSDDLAGAIASRLAEEAAPPITLSERGTGDDLRAPRLAADAPIRVSVCAVEILRVALE